MGQAVVRGLLKAQWATPAQLVASHPDPVRCEALSKSLGIRVVPSNAACVQGAEAILLGVKPQILKDILQELKGVVRKEQMVLSIAAGVSTATIESVLPDVPVVRSMPNLPVTVGLGATAIAPGSKASRQHMDLARAIFQSVGIVEEVPEKLLDAVTGLSGTGPLYVFHFLEAMGDAGVKVGLSRATAVRLAMQTLEGSARLALLSGKHPGELRDQVTSPGGTAITALHVLRKEAFSAIVMDAVEAAAKRSKELGS